jgi:hypothetical protein
LDVTGINVPVYYEQFDVKKEIPCITYLELNNSDYANGDSLSYSEVAFQVKIWAETISEIQTIALKVDIILKSAGFGRSLAVDRTDENLCVKIMRYDGIGFEK